MIVTEDGDDLRVITQADHARFAYQILSLWREDGLPAHPRRRELLFAVREHDNGWREADAAPSLDPRAGAPHDFQSLPDSARLELWRRGAARYLAESPYAALLIVEHARVLHRQSDSPAWREWLEQLDELQRERMRELGVERAELESDYSWLDLADRLSLAVCCGWRQSVAGRGYSGQWGPEGLRLRPFPLAGATTFEIPCRRLPRRRYRGDADLGGELAAARWERLGVRLLA